MTLSIRGRTAWPLAVTVIALGALTACGQLSDPAPLSAAAQADVLEQARRIDGQIAGTSQQRDAGNRLTYTTLQGAILTCAREQGVDYWPPRYHSTAHDDVGARLWWRDDVLAPVDPTHVEAVRLYVAVDLQAGESQTQQEQTDDAARLAELGDDGVARVSQVVGSCLPDTSTYQDIGLAKIGSGVAGDFEDLLETVRTERTVSRLMGQYRGCLAAAGFEAGSRNELINNVQASFYVRGKPAPADSPDRKVAEDREARAAAADADCRREAHERAMALLAPKLRHFATERRTDLDAAATAWARIVTEADRASPRFAELARAAARGTS